MGSEQGSGNAASQRRASGDRFARVRSEAQDNALDETHESKCGIESGLACRRRGGDRRRYRPNGQGGSRSGVKQIALAIALAAIGDTHALPPALRCALNPAAFEALPAPGPNDWLANHPERGQTFDDFVSSHPNRPTPQQHTIYLQPLGTFNLGPLKEFTEAFFMMPVVVRPPLDLATAKITSRT